MRKKASVVRRRGFRSRSALDITTEYGKESLVISVVDVSVLLLSFAVLLFVLVGVAGGVGGVVVLFRVLSSGGDSGSGSVFPSGIKPKMDRISLAYR